MDFKKVNAPTTTVTYDRDKIDDTTDNIYKAISIISKRTVQINEDIKKELISKLEEFATPSENLEEIFEIKSKLKSQSFMKDFQKLMQLLLIIGFRKKSTTENLKISSL